MRAHRLAPSLAAALVAAALASTGCSKDIPTQETLTPSSPSGTDANAGTWRMIVLSGPTQIDVPAPAPASSESYQAEIAAIKTAQASITDAQRQTIDYWAGGGVLRWNQVMRELVARYNLPPAPRDNGTYVFPDANNPFADPQFPFANPPYAARAYSYLAVAQYEALKVAWYYKFLYNRPSPSQVDGTVQALLPASNVPAYPSEDAVLSGVSTEMLRLLFPAAARRSRSRRAQQREAALLGGKGFRERHRGGAGAREGRGRGARGPRRHGRYGSGRRHAGAVAGPRGRAPRRAGRSRGRAWSRPPGRRCSRTSARCARG